MQEATILEQEEEQEEEIKEEKNVITQLIPELIKNEYSTQIPRTRPPRPVNKPDFTRPKWVEEYLKIRNKINDNYNKEKEEEEEEEESEEEEKEEEEEEEEEHKYLYQRMGKNLQLLEEFWGKVEYSPPHEEFSMLLYCIEEKHISTLEGNISVKEISLLPTTLQLDKFFTFKKGEVTIFFECIFALTEIDAYPLIGGTLTTTQTEETLSIGYLSLQTINKLLVPLLAALQNKYHDNEDNKDNQVKKIDDVNRLEIEKKIKENWLKDNLSCFVSALKQAANVC